jgi:hypothetical protein
MKWILTALVAANTAALLVILSSASAALHQCQLTHSHDTCFSQLNR